MEWETYHYVLRASSIGSHPLKATFLSWAAKFGIAPASRRKLGGHVKPKDVTLTTYSRDELAGPLRDLDKVLLAVRLGVFIPDCTRSGRFTQDSAATAALDEVFPEVPTPCISADDTISSSSDSSSSASECVDTDDASSGEDSRIVAISEDMAGVTAPMKLPDLPCAGLARNLANGVCAASGTPTRCCADVRLRSGTSSWRPGPRDLSLCAATVSDSCIVHIPSYIHGGIMSIRCAACRGYLLILSRSDCSNRLDVYAARA